MRSAFVILLAICSGSVYAANNADDAATARGQVVYGKFCSKCHGQNGDGRGRDAWKYHPAPTNFHVAGAVRPYMEEITKKGGKGVGRSDDMPEWGGDLTEEQIQDVVNYVMAMREHK